jgi:hypothetical protein
MVHLDLLSSLPFDWLIWARIPTFGELQRMEVPLPSPLAYSPLRC